LSHYFGLHPWDVPNLSLAELNGYLEALDQIEKANRNAARKR